MLPATTFLEHYDIAKGYGAYHLHLVQPVIMPVGEARPNHDVFRELGVRLGQAEPGDDLGEAGRADRGRRPAAGRAGRARSSRRARRRAGRGRPIQFVDVFPQTPNGRVHLFPESLPPAAGLYAYVPDPAHGGAIRSA